MRWVTVTPPRASCAVNQSRAVPAVRGASRVLRIVAMGATAAQRILGRTFRLTEHRGEVVLDPAGRPVVATLHPSAILRMDDDARRAAERAAFTDDLRHAASLALASAGTARR